MSNLIVIVFDDIEEAGKVKQSLKSIEGGGYISFDDSAVVTKDEEGEVHIHDEIDRGVVVGALGGSALGLLIGGLMFPIGGLLIGAAGGAAVGALLDKGIQKDFIKEVGESMGPNSSALFIIVREADPTMALAALRPYKGKVIQSSLPPEAEEELRRILSQRIE